ncbi:hypothetical protein TI03_05910 [Achromatium sp. WMS1]|nr:hypothetical protein TI03_05910 [Achromatium sp. WMS1]
MITATDSGGLSKSQHFTITVQDVPADTNNAPSDINLDNQKVTENVTGDIVGTLTVTDPDDDTTFTYRVNDERFEVDGAKLKLKADRALDYEVEPTVDVTVTATDSSGSYKSQLFTIEVRNVTSSENSAPTDIALDDLKVTENVTGDIVGTLTVTDPDGDTSFTYTVDDTRFEVDGAKLKLKADRALDYEVEPTVNVTVTATDSSGASTSQLFIIEVQDLDFANVAPTAIELTDQQIIENVQGDVVGTLIVTDPNGDTSFIYSVDDERFEIDAAGQLKLKDNRALDYEAQSTVYVTVTAIDTGGLSWSHLLVIKIDIAWSVISISGNILHCNGKVL